MLNLCGIVAAILKMATGRNFSMSGINSGHHYLPTYQILMISNNVEFLRYCGSHFENGDRQKFSMSGHHYLPTYQIWMTSDNVEFLPPIFLCRVLAAILKILKHRIAPLIVTYHYVKFYVSIIIYLEVININVRNFKFPIGFYNNHHPL